MKLKKSFDTKRREIQRRKAIKYWRSLTKIQLLEITKAHGMRFSKLTSKYNLVAWLDYHINECGCGC